MSGRVAGRSVIITGAGSGLGRAFALALAEEGATVGVLDVNEAAAATVCAEIGTRSGAAGVALTADVSRREQVIAAFDMFLDRAGRLDVLFNNAGFNRPMKLLDVTEERTGTRSWTSTRSAR